MRTDEELVRAIHEGDLKAFDELYTRYSGRLFGYIHRLLNNRAAAEDVFRTLATEPLEDRDLEALQEHAVETLDALERTLATLNDEHRRVIELWLQGFAAPEIDGVSDANVHQIVSRFRRALRGELQAGGDTG